MSNNLIENVYYNIIVKDMEKFAKKELSKDVRLLSININLELLDRSFDGNLFDVKTSLEKKSKEILFLKTTLVGNKNTLIQATAIWSIDI